MSRKSSIVILAVAVLAIIATGVSVAVFAPSQSTPHGKPLVGEFETVLNDMEADSWVPFCVNMDTVKSASDVKVIPSAGHMLRLVASRSGYNTFCGRYYAPRTVARPEVAHMRLKSHGQLVAEYQFELLPEASGPVTGAG